MLMNESGGGRKEKVAGLGGREGKNYLLLRTPSTLPLSVALPLRRARIRLERCIFQPSRLRSQKKPCFSLCVDQLLGSNGMHTTSSMSSTGTSDGSLLTAHMVAAGTVRYDEHS